MDDEPKPLILQWVSLYLSGVGHWNNSLNDFLNTLSFTKRLNLATAEGQSHRPIALFAYTFFSTLHRKQLGFPWNIFRSRWSSDTGRQAGRQKRSDSSALPYAMHFVGNTHALRRLLFWWAIQSSPSNEPSHNIRSSHSWIWIIHQKSRDDDDRSYRSTVSK